MSVEKNQPGIKLETVFRQRGFQRKIKSNEIIFMENDREDCLFYIAEGMVKLFMLSPDGKEKTLTILAEGQVFGEMAIFGGLAHCLNAETLVDTVIYSMTSKDVREVMGEEPELVFELLRSMANKMRLTTLQIKDMVFYDIAGRMASQLLTFAEQFGVKQEKGILLRVLLTHQELANLLGASRVTVTKTLNQFAEEGLIEIQNRRIVITDPDRMRSYIR